MPPDDLEVFPAGQLFLNGGRLPGQPDRPADRGRVPHHVIALYYRAAAVGHQQGRQDSHGGRLARAVGAKDAKDRPARHRQIDAPKGLNRAERLGQTLDEDRWLPVGL
jgi:hypothetical protein